MTYHGRIGKADALIGAISILAAVVGLDYDL